MAPIAQYSLRRQYGLGRWMVFILAPLTALALRLMGYRIRNLEAVRRRVAGLLARHPGPWLICANHLTWIDSVILILAMLPIKRYMLDYRLLPWNLPEYMNFNRSRSARLICFLSKCIPVIRGGDRAAMNLTLEKCMAVLRNGENLMLFPEGGRSRSGRIDPTQFSYGVGRLYLKVPRCRVMCIYLRGDGQTRAGIVPRRRETFTMTVAECRPHTTGRGLKAQRDCAAQVLACLAQLEQEYFNGRRSRQ
jgi:1-acyl-sn-glycerol-3-phosphate acyltransferase